MADIRRDLNMIIKELEQRAEHAAICDAEAALTDDPTERDLLLKTAAMERLVVIQGARWTVDRIRQLRG